MPNDMTLPEGFFAFCDRRDAEDRIGAAAVSTAPAMQPVRPSVAAMCWCDHGMTPEEMEAWEIDPAALAARYAESDALQAWQALRGEGLTGADAAAIVCGEG